MKKFLILSLLVSSPLWAEETSTSTETFKTQPTPIFTGFIRSLEVEGAVASLGDEKSGAQSWRFETRNLDPDVNAFVGMIITGTRFNEHVRLGTPPDESRAKLLMNWGVDMGMIRGRHTWALDLMGASLGSHLAFGPAIVGEHQLGKQWVLFHRTTADFFVGDTLLDSDQGLLWKPWQNLGFTLGYRVFVGSHFNRNGPRAGLWWRFESPKIPFLFPSIG